MCVCVWWKDIGMWQKYSLIFKVWINLRYCVFSVFTPCETMTELWVSKFMKTTGCTDTEVPPNVLAASEVQLLYSTWMEKRHVVVLWNKIYDTALQRQREWLWTSKPVGVVWSDVSIIDYTENLGVQHKIASKQDVTAAKSWLYPWQCKRVVSRRRKPCRYSNYCSGNACFWVGKVKIFK